MARTRQQHPNNYRSSQYINDEFESIIRVLNAAEMGGKTIAEIFKGFLDSDGNFHGPVEFRFDTTRGMEYRVGVYTTDATGWTKIADYAQLRGQAGSSSGTIAESPIQNITYYSATSSQTVFDYFHDTNDTLLVYKGGLLQREGSGFDYTRSQTAGSGSTPAIVFNTGVILNTQVMIARVRANNPTYLRRTDHFTSTTQSAFSFDFTGTVSDPQVYKNGLLLRPGITNDYTYDTTAGVVTLTSPVPNNTLVSITAWLTSVDTRITGIMLETDYVDATTGKINYGALKIADNEIPQVKVNGLADKLQFTAKTTAGNSTPVSPAPGDVWVDTSTNPAQVKVWDGIVWLRTNVESIVPTYTAANANQVLQVNSLGSAIQWGAINTNALVPKTYMGAASGVATLDVNGRLPVNQLPSVVAQDSIYYYLAGSISNATYPMRRVYKQQIILTGISARLTSGTANAKLSVAGSDVGDTFALSSTPVEQAFAVPIQVDARTVSKMIGVTISSQSSANGLEVVYSAELVPP